MAKKEEVDVNNFFVDRKRNVSSSIAINYM